MITGLIVIIPAVSLDEVLTLII